VGSRISGEKVEVGVGSGAAVGLLQADRVDKPIIKIMISEIFFILNPFDSFSNIRRGISAEVPMVKRVDRVLP
jgi:hypothetical protein